MSAMDAVYLPKPSTKKPDDFQGFIELEIVDRKPEWRKYVFLPNYYSHNAMLGTTDLDYDNRKEKEIDKTLELYNPRFGYIYAKTTNINPKHIEHLSKNYSDHKVYYETNKQKLMSNSISKVKCFNVATSFIHSEKCFYSNGEYVIRQAGIYEIEDVQKLLKQSQKENPGMFQDSNYSSDKIAKHVLRGGFVVVVNPEGKFVGGQGITPKENSIEAEPFTYISKEARGQGIFAIYHEIISEAGKEIDAEYIYARYNTSNETARIVYKSYGYIEQPEIKKVENREVYEIKFPLK